MLYLVAFSRITFDWPTIRELIGSVNTNAFELSR
jgi:hypothetical protein